MQVQQLMTPAPHACAPGTNLCEAVQLMWEGDFGAIPVTDKAGVVRGIVTDRDISIALGTRNRRASQLRVSDVMSGTVQTCRADDDISAAMQSMRERHVRRLPVVDADGRLCGILSLNDVALAGDSSIAPTEIVETLRTLCVHRKPSEHPLAAVTA